MKTKDELIFDSYMSKGKKVGIAFAAFWVFTFFLGLGFLGLLTWAIIRVVLKYT